MDKEEDKMKLSRAKAIFRGEVDLLDQKELLWWLDATRRNAWDIPSALGSLCDHLDMDIFPMHHRDWADPDEYPSLASYVMADNAHWDEVEDHFYSIHGLNLRDERINWSFDT